MAKMVKKESMEVETVETVTEEKVQKKKKGFWGIIITALGLLFGKLKFLLAILKMGKFLTTFGSMFLMIITYAQFYGWSFAIGFVLLIFVHEMGHCGMAKKIGMNVSAPIFIPFVGAAIAMKEQPKDAITEAKLAAGGPVAGSMGALVCVFLYYFSKQDFFLALAYTGFMLNIFNLIPIHPLDGGRMVSAISTKIWLVGIPIAIVAAINFFNPIILLILALGIYETYKSWKNPNNEYFDVPFKTRLIFAIIFFGMIILLGTGMTYIHDLHQGKFLVS